MMGETRLFSHPLSEISSHLIGKHGGNVQKSGIVIITSKSIGNEQGQWIYWVGEPSSDATVWAGIGRTTDNQDFAGIKHCALDC
jgi:hypothetical protein